MKCIKEKCGYYKEHDFKESYAVCSMSYKVFNKNNSNIDCLIDDIISDMEDNLYDLKNYSKVINKNQQRREVNEL